MENTKKVFVITWANTFIHSYEQNGWLNFEYAKRATLFLAREGGAEYWAKTSIFDYKFHPEYLKHPGLHGGFDIAVASFDITKSKSFIKDLEVFKNMLRKIAPSLTSINVKNGDELFITGYPGETGGYMHQIKAKIFDTISVDDDTTKLLVFKDIRASGGLSGAPVLKIDENKTQLLGLYLGYDQSWDMHIVAAITYNINK